MIVAEPNNDGTENNKANIRGLDGYILSLPEEEYYLESDDEDDETGEDDDDEWARMKTMKRRGESKMDEIGGIEH